MKKNFLIVLGSIFLFVVIFFAVDFIFAKDLIYIVEPENTQCEYGEKYNDPGIYATRENLITHIHIKYNWTTSGAVGNEEGEYTLSYQVENKDKTVLTRKVSVIDTQGPEILFEETTIHLNKNSLENNHTFQAMDAHDGKVEVTIKITENTNEAILEAVDQKGNKTQKVVSIEWVDELPSIVLLGEEAQEINEFKPYQDPGYIALDSYGNDLSDFVVVEGKVRGAIPTKSYEGEQILDPYVLTYSYTNEKGEKTEAKRTINIIGSELPQTKERVLNTVYITFDDGPSAYTSTLLDILKKHNVKVTFFVTNQFENQYVDMIKRAYEEGHTIGAHTYTHNYSKLYANLEAYLDDLQAIQDIIYEQTGSYTRLVRFPGGTSNTVSRNAKGLMTTLSQIMPKMGYQYYDWNATCGDGSSHTQEETIEFFKYYVERQSETLMLCHDSKYNTVSVMDEILTWLEGTGKELKTLELDTYPHHHGPNN